MSKAQDDTSRVSRRRLLAVAGGLGIAGVAGAVIADEKLNHGDAASAPGTGQVPFTGPHQAGIATPAQHYLHFATFDVTTTSRDDLVTLLKKWSAAAARMTAADTAADLTGSPVAPPTDTGEALGLDASRLTLTFGFGPTLFTSTDGTDRFGIAAQRPEALIDIPPFTRDELVPGRSGGDIGVQACADDPQVAFHAIRNLARIGRGSVVMRWSQLGFNRTASTSKKQTTPRNLMGFKDGTNNIKADDEADLSRHVWVGDEGPGWMQGGSYLVARRIRMTIEHWDRTALQEQEATVGRAKVTGAPIGLKGEFDTVDLSATAADGKTRIPADAHIRVAAPASNDGVKLLRRGYSFTDGMDAIGELDAGLFFLAYQKDPRAQFVLIQRRLAANDRLNEYIAHNGSAIFACPGGVSSVTDWVGRRLFEST